jgi:MFS family permease
MDRRSLFFTSCVALVTTAISFSMRGDVLDALGADYHLNHEQLGLILSPAFWGNTVSILIGGSLVDYLGMRRLLQVSSIGYILAPLLMIFAPRPAGPVTPYYTDPGFICLYAGMLMLGLCQGLVEGVINPLVATIYSDDKTHRFNVLHSWWPGGLIIGSLLAYAITRMMGLDAAGVSASRATLGWQVKMAIILLPAAAYGVLLLKQQFPKTERVAAGVSSRDMFREALRPMFLLLFVCMWMTSSAELGPDQWVGPIIMNLTGMRGILILAYTSGIMFLLRFFVGGKLAHQFSPLGLLTISSVLTAVGLFSLASVHAWQQAFVAATIFGVGKTFFWPTMLGVTSERFPRGGALLLAIMGGAGNLAVAFILPWMGKWYDEDGAATAFRYVGVLPIILTMIFGASLVYYKSTGGYRAIVLKTAEPSIEARADGGVGG